MTQAATDEITRKQLIKQRTLAKRKAQQAKREYVASIGTPGMIDKRNAYESAKHGSLDASVPLQRRARDLDPQEASIRRRTLKAQQAAIQQAGGFQPTPTPEGPTSDERAAKFRLRHDRRMLQNRLGVEGRPETLSELERLREPAAQERATLDRNHEQALSDKRDVTSPPNTSATVTGADPIAHNRALMQRIQAAQRNAEKEIAAANVTDTRGLDAMASDQARLDLAGDVVRAGEREQAEQDSLHEYEQSRIKALSRQQAFRGRAFDAGIDPDQGTVTGLNADPSSRSQQVTQALINWGGDERFNNLADAFVSGNENAAGSILAALDDPSLTDSDRQAMAGLLWTRIPENIKRAVRSQRGGRLSKYEDIHQRAIERLEVLTGRRMAPGYQARNQRRLRAVQERQKNEAAPTPTTVPFTPNNQTEARIGRVF